MRLILILLLSAASCARGECDYWDPRDAINRREFDLMEHASDIVVGRIKALKVGRTTHSCRQPSLRLEPVAMEVSVENVLAGESKAQSIEVSYFQFSSTNSNGYSGPPLFRPEVGERRVLFLDRSSDRLRLVGDVYDYTIRVASGNHSRFDAGTMNRWTRLAHILLTLGDGYDERAMTRFIPRYSELIDHFGSRVVTAELLKRLAQQAPGSIRLAACLHLAAQYPGQYGCLRDLLSVGSLHQRDRQRVEEALESQSRRNERLRKALTQNALRALSSVPFPDSLARMREEFLMLSQDPDPSVAQLACRSLVRFWNEQPSQCNPSLRRP